MTSNVLLFLCFSTLYLTRCDASNTELYANTTNDGDVTETQHATCKITTEELVASARATVTRVLTGACSAKTMDEKLQSLERNLTLELEKIKTILYTVLQNKRDTARLSKTPCDEKLNHNDHPVDDTKNGNPSPRQPEIDKTNGVVQEIFPINGSTSVFFYYWQIKNFSEKLASWRTARFERSETFYVGQNGYAMYIKVTPRHSDDTVFISVGLTRGRHDFILRWPFPHKMRLEVLDHSPEQSRQDRRSRFWDPSLLCSEYFWSRPKLTGEPDNPDCVGLSVSRQVFFAKLPFSNNMRYLWNGSVTIKLTVLL
ncbi:uncharacterized protein LOC143145739 [Ptiloglossa arizonensis]|uniref:uncharacterized protein LOC143145739 n=1 Tax=Ptiloglossa arizonensis TaxID=3350558 RepID=UPI003F9FA494